MGYKNASSTTTGRTALGGEGKLSFMSRIKYAMDAITSFSYKPLRLSFGLFASHRVARILGISTMLFADPFHSAGFGVARAFSW